jgi:hypothetical protein
MEAKVTEARNMLAVIAASGPFNPAGLDTLPCDSRVKAAMHAICRIHGLPVDGGKIVIHADVLADAPPRIKLHGRIGGFQD